MSIFQRSRLPLFVAGLGLCIAGPVAAAEQPGSWALNSDQARYTVPASLPAVAPRPQLAFLPPPPAAARTFAITPERKALLNTIRYAEGTWANGHEMGYRTLFGGTLVNSLERHPDRVMYTRRYASAAAGAYQFMPFTWNMVSQALRLSRFDPQAQDQAALFLVKRRGALALADRGELTPELAARLAPEWASFPTLAGQSYYGQPVRRFDDLKRFYEQSLAELRETGVPTWENVAIRKVRPACNDNSLACRLESIGPRPISTN